MLLLVDKTHRQALGPWRHVISLVVSSSDPSLTTQPVTRCYSNNFDGEGDERKGPQKFQARLVATKLFTGNTR